MYSAQDDLRTLPFVSAREAASFEAAGINNAKAALEFFPRRYEDRRNFDNFPNQPTSSAVCLRGKVVDTKMRRIGKGRGFYEAVVMNGTGGVFGSGTVVCRWFNMPFMHKVVAVGQDVVVYGKVKESNQRLIIDHPEIEVLRDDMDAANSVNLERIVPIYRGINGISQRRLREIMYLLLGEIEPGGLETLTREFGLKARAQSIKEAHFPECMEQAQQARRRFAFEEFFAIQLNVVWRRARLREQSGRVLGKKTALLTRFYNSLPFDLTDAQKRSVREIIADMRQPRPMNRLLQGDVGSGKTFVAMAAMLLAIDSGCQAALMAPTQILAEQHFLTFRTWLEPMGIRVSLRTGSREHASHLELEGKPQIVIGTHALLYEGSVFDDLGLVVIDEQHKFGVAQRAALIRRGMVPDVLVMTATPIPRTLTMTLYGDLDVSLLNERPPGRGKVVTAVRQRAKQTNVTGFVREQLDAGRQAYLVYPLVEESESSNAESATEAIEKWRKRLSGYEVGLLHGRLRSEEKEGVMSRFRNGEIKALVCTSVIEVGVDVPNANIMIIHDADRFGLAQLHQMRGRIGRGGMTGYCVLLTSSSNTDAIGKLTILEGCADGFEIAEADLQLRGPGDVLGTMQSGVSQIRFVEFISDTGLIKEARELADRVISEDPTLQGKHRNLGCWITKDADEAAFSGGL